jgi:hypothetical protein
MSGLGWRSTGGRLSDIGKSWRSSGGRLGHILATTAPSSASRTPNGALWCAPWRRSTPSRTGDRPPPSGSGTSWSPMLPPCSASPSRAPLCSMPQAASRTGNAGASLARCVGLPRVVDARGAPDLVHTLIPKSWSRGVPDFSHDSTRIIIEEKIRIGTNAVAQVLHCPPNRGQPMRAQRARGPASGLCSRIHSRKLGADGSPYSFGSGRGRPWQGLESRRYRS